MYSYVRIHSSNGVLQTRWADGQKLERELVDFSEEFVQLFGRFVHQSRYYIRQSSLVHNINYDRYNSLMKKKTTYNSIKINKTSF